MTRPRSFALAFVLLLVGVGLPSRAQETSPPHAPGAPGAPGASGAPGVTVDALQSARSLATSARAEVQAGRQSEARDAVARAVELALSRPAPERDAAALKLLDDLAGLAFELELPRIERDVWMRVVPGLEAGLDADEPSVQRARGYLAETLSVLGELDAAEALQVRVLAGFERKPPADANDIQVARMNLAATRGRKQDLAGARVLVEQVLEVWKRTLPADAPELLQARQYLLNVLNGLGEAADACTEARSLLADTQRVVPEESPLLATVRMAAAQAFERCGDLEGATRVLRDAVATLERTRAKDNIELLVARRNLGLARLQSGDLLEAARQLETVLEVQEHAVPAGDPALITARMDLAQVRLAQGELALAAALIDPSLESAERALRSDDPALAPLQIIASQLRLRQGDVVAARRLAESALANFERTCAPDHPNVTSAQLTLCSALSDLGDLPGACALQRAVLASRERTLPEDAPRLTIARQELATTLGKLGDFKAALELQRRVLASDERTLPPDSLELAASRLNLASILHSSGDADAARALLEQVVARCDAGVAEDHPTALQARGNLATLCLERGELERARALAERALAALVRHFPAGHPDVQRARCNRCWILVAAKDATELEAELDRVALGLDARLGGALALAPRETWEAARSARADLDVLLSLGPRVDRPEEFRRRTFELAESLRALSIAPPLPSAMIAKDPELTSLVERVRAGRRAFEAETPNLGGPRAESPSSTGASEPASLAAPTAPALATAPTAPTLIDRVRAQDALETQLRRRMTQARVPAIAIDLDRVVDALRPRSAFVGYLRYTEIEQDPAEHGWRQQASERICAHVVVPREPATDSSGERPPARVLRVDLGPVARIEAAVERWRAAIGRPLGGPTTRHTESEQLEAGTELRRLVVDPLLHALGDARVLHVCLDDVLHLVPLDALPLDPASQPDARTRLVGERWRIVDEVSLSRMLTPADPVTIAPTLLAVGGVAFDAEIAAPEELPFATSEPIAPIAAPLLADARDPARGIGAVGSTSARWPPLPETAVEVREVGALFARAFGRPASMLEGGQATKHALFERTGAARYVHVATHGYAVDEAIARAGAQEGVAGLAPMALCGLVLAGANRTTGSRARWDGILTGEELSGFDFSQCELAVLSACETAGGVRGSGQGVQSLRAALHAAGARMTITSLWPVGDAATRELFADFYARVWVHGEPIAQALWNAKVARRAGGAPTSDWAGWVLSGWGE